MGVWITPSLPPLTILSVSSVSSPPPSLSTASPTPQDWVGPLGPSELGRGEERERGRKRGEKGKGERGKREQLLGGRERREREEQYTNSVAVNKTVLIKTVLRNKTTTLIIDAQLLYRLFPINARHTSYYREK